MITVNKRLLGAMTVPIAQDKSRPILPKNEGKLTRLPRMLGKSKVVEVSGGGCVSKIWPAMVCLNFEHTAPVSCKWMVQKMLKLLVWIFILS